MLGNSFKLEETLLILIDLAEGPLAAVGSMPQGELRQAVQSIGQAAGLLGLPVLQLKAPFPAAAARALTDCGSAVGHTTNDAWQSPEVVNAVAKSGRRQLAFAGIATEVGVCLTALSAARAGYQCLVLADACGTVNARAESAAFQRLTLAGIPLQSWSGFFGEIQADYTTGKGPDLLKLMSFRSTLSSHQVPATGQGSDREARGLATLERIAGEKSAQPLSDWSQLAPDMRNFIVEFIAGDVLSRPELDLKSRQLATVAMLIAIGGVPDEFRMHLAGALRVGWKQSELIELILQSAPFAGFPKALNALKWAAEVFGSNREPAAPGNE